MPNSIIASSLLNLPTPTLRGFAQIGGDLVLGDSGRAAYGDIPPGHDGAYVSVSSHDASEVRVGTDASGYGRLFIYQRGHRWALGTSLMELADYVSHVGWPLGIDPLLVKQFLFRSNMLVNQLLSLDTVFPEIRLVGASEEVAIGTGHVPSFTVRRRETPAGDNYASAMQDALDEMLGRLKTLISSGLPVVSSISGGRDSRTVLAALRAASESPLDLGTKIRFRSNEHQRDDWAVAQSLSKIYRLAVNRAPASPEVPVDPEHSYAVWRANDLGVYSAIYQFLTYTPEVSLSGVGGETHRAAYSDRTLEHRLQRMQTEHVTDLDVRNLALRIRQSLDHLGGHRDRHLEHYRQFRNRFHGGRAPLRTITVAPLNTQKFRLASSLMSPENIKQAQFLADIMLNLAPDLAAEEYDVPEKKWQQTHHEQLTKLTADPDRYAGSVYGELNYPPTIDVAPARPLELFVDAFKEAAPHAVESGLLPQNYVEEASKTLQATRVADSRSWKRWSAEL